MAFSYLEKHLLCEYVENRFSDDHIKKLLQFICPSHIYRWKQKQIKNNEVINYAVSKNLLGRNLALEYQDGLDKKGISILKKVTYKNIKLTAEPEALMEVVDAINPLIAEGK